MGHTDRETVHCQRAAADTDSLHRKHLPSCVQPYGFSVKELLLVFLNIPVIWDWLIPSRNNYVQPRKIMGARWLNRLELVELLEWLSQAGGKMLTEPYRTVQTSYSPPCASNLDNDRPSYCAVNTTQNCNCEHNCYIEHHCYLVLLNFGDRNNSFTEKQYVQRKTCWVQRWRHKGPKRPLMVAKVPEIL